jgi:hypothetical protein
MVAHDQGGLAELKILALANRSRIFASAFRLPQEPWANDWTYQPRLSPKPTEERPFRWV